MNVQGQKKKIPYLFSIKTGVFFPTAPKSGCLWMSPLLWKTQRVIQVHVFGVLQEGIESDLIAE